jgi:adenine-specific DNA-methyltransferase
MTRPSTRIEKPAPDASPRGLRRILVPCPRRGIGAPSLDGHLLIDGDNLEALTALDAHLHGQVGLALIDPPYNTGNRTWQYDDAKRGSDGDDWIRLMEPRLRAIHLLLARDGLLIMHIDEHEAARATLLIDAIFGNDPANPSQRNRIGNLIWDKGNPKGDAQGLAYQHETLIIAARNRSAALARRPFSRPKAHARAMLNAAQRFTRRVGSHEAPADLAEVVSRYDLALDPTAHAHPYSHDDAASDFARWVRTQRQLSGGERQYNKLDREGRVYRLVHMGWPNKKPAPPAYSYPIPHPVSRHPCPMPARGWRYPPETMLRMLGNDPPVREPLGRIRQGEVVFGPDATTQPQRRYFLAEHARENIPSIVRFGGSDDALLASMGLLFENPKPHRFVLDLLRWFSTPDDLILDCYAGSGTTGHAVLLANQNDGGTRRFVLVQRDEGPGRVSAERTTATRLRHVITGWGADGQHHEGSGGTFTYCTLAEPEDQ